MGCLFGGCDNRRNDDYYPRRRPCDRCGSYGPGRDRYDRFDRYDRYDRYDDRYDPGRRSIFPRFPRLF